MPWLQLEDDNLDKVKVVPPSPKKVNKEEVEPVIVLVSLATSTHPLTFPLPTALPMYTL